ncbi:hypothetical protein BC834DRAFT_414976 [Gloeopeniophorella convolvens]|nr:hypothetical protein BC834DRAFT_414976 [Gloeopeniophorella convolvens]
MLPRISIAIRRHQRRSIASLMSRFWSFLMHIARVPHVGIGNGLALHLTLGSPVSDILLHSPPLPIEMQYESVGYDHLGFSRPWPPESVDGATLALSKHLDRVTSIGFRATQDLLRNLLKRLSVTTPQLETLQIHSDLPMFLLPANFLGGSPPALRILSLTNILPSLKLQFLHLTTFSFVLGGETRVRAQYLIVLVQSLHAMQALEYLQLGLPEDLLVGTQFHPSFPADTSISFPRLSRVVFRGSNTHFEAVIRHIDAPALVSLDLHFLTRFHFPTTIPSLSRFIRSSAKLLALQSAYVGLSNGTGCIKTYPSSPDDGKITLEICYDVPKPSLLVGASVAALCTSLEPVLSTAKTLAIRHYVPDPAPPGVGMFWDTDETEETDGVRWHAMLACFSGATNVKVENKFSLITAQTLQQPAGLGLLPNLDELQLLYTEDGDDASDILAAFEPFLKARNTPLHLLNVYCTVIPRHRDGPGPGPGRGPNYAAFITA